MKSHPPARIAFVLAIGIATAGLVSAQETGWPRVVKDGPNQIVIYQPQPDSLDGVTLQSRVAVSIKRPQDKAPLFGALWVISTLSVDRDQDIAHVVSVKIDRTRFADVPPADVQSLVDFLEREVPKWDLSISLTRLRAALQPADNGPDDDYRNDPPKIIIENRPAILLLLDGQPRLQSVGQDLERVANTALPVIYDARNKQYWFYASSIWFTTRDLLNGQWTAVDQAPAQIQSLVKDQETLKTAQDDSGKAADPAQLRSARIIVTTQPTELIVIQGNPQYTPLGAGDILYVNNTDSDILMEVATQRHFILLSGRWYAGPSIKGPWTFISPDQLPKSFAGIPDNSAKANVLAFVPGTDRAKDAVMDNVIPQTAEVSRNDAKLNVTYDGQPKFTPIPDTNMAYAQNTPSQVIQADGKYFACDDGVWYVAPSPTGPWSVSDVRPVEIENVPPSSPVYNTKYVYIYDSTPDVVYVGYLPGYRWSFPYRGVVVYGTGWYYPGWWGTYYYPRPATWGFCVRYNPWYGWSFGMSWTSGWLGISSGWGWGWAGWGPPGYYRGFWGGYYGGWFGPGGYRPPQPPAWRPYRPGYGPRPYRPNGFGPRPWHGNNIYNRPGRDGIRPRTPAYPVRTQPVDRGRPAGPVTRPDTRRPNNVFVDRDGNIHRNQGGNWQTRQGRGWRPEPAPGTPSRPVTPGTPARPGGAPSRPSIQPARPVAPPSRPATPERRPSAPSFRTEPRGGGSMEGESRARERGTQMMRQPSRGGGGSPGRRR